MTPIQAEVAGLLVRLEALQEMVANVACLHRVFFQRLVWHARTHTTGSGSEAGPLPQNDSDETDHEHALHTFLEQHFLQDALMLDVQVRHRAPQLRALWCCHAKQCCLASIVGRSRGLVGICRVMPQQLHAMAALRFALDAFPVNMHGPYCKLP